jgi:hypothetical protein
MRRTLQIVAVVAVLGTALVSAAQPAGGEPSFGSDAAFPVAGIAPNTILEPPGPALSPVFGPTVPPPVTAYPSLLTPPLAPGVGEVDDFSYGNDSWLGVPFYVEFSAGIQFGGGVPTGHPAAPPPPVPAFDIRQEAGVFPPAPFGDGVTLSDVYINGMVPFPGPVPCLGPGTNMQTLDGIGAPPAPPPPPFGAPRLGIGMPEPGSNLDAFDRSDDTVVNPVPGVPLEAPVFFTIDAVTAAGWPGGAPIPAPGGGVALPAPSDILAWNPAIGGPVIFATDGALGLTPGDDIDARAVSYDGAPLPPVGPGWDIAPGGSYFTFSLAPGSVQLAASSGGAAGPLPSACGGAGTGTAADLWAVLAPVAIGATPPFINAEVLGLATVRTGVPADDNIDAIDLCIDTDVTFTDIDGDFIDDGCDFDMDGDGIGNGADPDDDGDGFGDPQSTTHQGPANTVIGTDNCPMVPNPGQANSDGNFIDTSPPFTGDDLTWPMSDMFGDACDNDDDNDGLLDTVESAGPPCASATAATSSTDWDSDNDRRQDGIECTLGFDPADPTSAPAIAACGPLGDTDADGLSDRIETCFYNTSTTVTNTDGDGCGDARETFSVDGNLTVNATDLGRVASATVPSGPYGTPPLPGDVWKMAMDMDKNGAVNAADLGLVASRFGACP